MVEIFKTNVKSKKLAIKVIASLTTQLPAFSFNFDLDDCDHILRVQSSGQPVKCPEIINIVEGHSIEISHFED